MPKVDDKNLAALVSNGEISAITIDTSIFDNYGRNFGNTLIASLDQFKKIDVMVVFSSIVAGEVKSHIERDAAKAHSDLLAALNAYRSAWRFSESVEDLSRSAKMSGDPALLASSEWDNFVNTVGASTIEIKSPGFFDVLMDSYFSGKPPFDKGGKKKSEFPDAIALLSLEQWAKEKHFVVIAVSKDIDWMNYSETSENIYCINELNQLYGLYNKNDEFLANKIITKIYMSNPIIFIDKIKESIENYYNNRYVQIQAESDTHYEDEFLRMDVLRCAKKDELLVISSEKNKITIDITFECIVEFSALFYWSIWDSVDKEYINISNDEITRQQECEFDIAITFIFDDNFNVDIENVDISRDTFDADFGFVGPRRIYE